LTSVTIHHEKPLQISGRINYFLISIVFNTLGNALTVAINLGSALWTASAVNLMHFAAVPLDVMLFIFGIAVILINILILRKLDWQRVIGNIIFMIPFSYLTGYMTQLLLVFNINLLPLAVRILFDLIGICFIAIGISIYQRVNLILHPCDDLMQIIRFKYFHGSATIAQLVTFAPPVVMIIITWLYSGQIYAINIGTLFALLFQGTLVGLFDRCIFPTLKHQPLIGHHAGSH
jgi:uncharacterized membrane protein YczE